jgi:hypothetical protein
MDCSSTLYKQVCTTFSKEIAAVPSKNKVKRVDRLLETYNIIITVHLLLNMASAEFSTDDRKTHDLWYSVEHVSLFAVKCQVLLDYFARQTQPIFRD